MQLGFVTGALLSSLLSVADEDAVGWRWAFALLAPGPALGVLAMLRLRRVPSPESSAS